MYFSFGVENYQSRSLFTDFDLFGCGEFVSFLYQTNIIT